MARGTPTSQHGKGWVPDLPDKRDRVFAQLQPAVPAAVPKIPPSVDLTSRCPPIEDQGQLSSCTANALAGDLEFLEMKDKVSFTPASRLFIYYNERSIEHTVPIDKGASIRDGIKTLAKQGVCPETEWPYDISKFAVAPGAACYSDAMKRKITSYYRLQTTDEMRVCLSQGYPFVFGFTVYQSFESAAVAKSGVVPLPGPGEAVVGGHAVVAVGYDDPSQRFRVRNSWGTSWGQKGYFTMPYQYLADRNLSDDFWVVLRGTEM
ncbi:MAG TPA: C1 family peptidase [Thermoplasmata archaeon]|nr:C1 family peptidase [Thermoplasmata archaeon]